MGDFIIIFLLVVISIFAYRSWKKNGSCDGDCGKCNH
ncbi:FeoB-associated Cys-rich membrane protein [Catellicoccus marimammalium]